jgi:uncharacterized membrane protein
MMVDGGGGVGGGGWSMDAFGLLWVLIVLSFLVLIVVLIAFAVRYFARTNPPTHGPWPGSQAAPPPVPPARWEPLDILRERFARGDITLDEFEAAKRALGYSSSPTPLPAGPGTPPTG